MIPLTSSAFVLLGLLQLAVLLASALVPFQLNWTVHLKPLPRLLRQLFWIYGGYVVLSIVSLGAICIVAASDLAAGGLLVRCFCIYGAAFWGIRLGLQAVMDARPHLTGRWLRLGYHALTCVFVLLTTLYMMGAVGA